MTRHWSYTSSANERARPFATLQNVLPGKDESEPRNPLDALVGAAHQEVDSDLGDIERYSTERAHGIHYEHASAASNHIAHGGHGVEHSGRGLSVDHGDVSYARILRQNLVDSAGIRGIELAAVEDLMGDIKHLGDPGEALAVRTVAQDQQFAVIGDRRAHQRLYDERAAPLHQHARVSLGYRGQLHELASDDLNDAQVVVVVPRAPVAEHHLLHARGGAERSGVRSR